MKLNNIIKQIPIALVMFMLSSWSIHLHAEVAVIVHPSNSSALTKNDVNRIFVGKMKAFPGGGKAEPVNQVEGTAATDTFNSSILNKSSSQLKAYWSKLVFTGKGNPPKALNSDADVIAYVAANPDAIGYISSGAAANGVKVITLSD